MQGRVVVPCEVMSEMRAAVYWMFLHNMPFSAFNVVKTLRFRLFFVRDDSVAHVQFTTLCILPYGGGPPFYQDLLNMFD